MFGILGPAGSVPSLQVYQGLLYVVLALGLWKGKSWAWVLLIVTAVVGIVSQLVVISTSIVVLGAYVATAGLAVDLVFIYVALRKDTKEYFRQVSVREQFA